MVFYGFAFSVHCLYQISAKLKDWRVNGTTIDCDNGLFTGPLIWNQLNPDFHIFPSVASFKFNYKKFLISGY